MDESKPKSDDLVTAADDYKDSDHLNRYFVDEELPTTSFDCSILSEFGWTTTTTTTTIQLQQERRRHSTDGDPFISDSMGKSESNSSVSGGFSLPSSSNMRVSTSNYTCVSSSSSDQDNQQVQVVEKSIGSDDQTRSPNVQIPSKKRAQKRIRQQRFAFVTKSEVDHLEDGYRWRKYGQKAVKNSPYPRSYYRCTNTKCTVKKRVERSCEDPTTVITTYEGQHCHQTAGFPRGSGLSIREAAFAVQMGPPNSQFYYPVEQHLPQQNPQSSNIASPVVPLQPTSVPSHEPRNDGESIVHTKPSLQHAGTTPHQFPSDDGLLGDIVSPKLRNNFHP